MRLGRVDLGAIQVASFHHCISKRLRDIFLALKVGGGSVGLEANCEVVSLGELATLKVSHLVLK